MNSCIYALCCPNSGEVRYVGKTCSPKIRLQSHLANAFNGSHKNKELANWITGLHKEGFKPVFTVLENCDSNGQLRKSESSWIRKFKNSGRLFNISQMDQTADLSDVGVLKRIVKEKKIRYKNLSAKIGVSRSAVSNFLNGRIHYLSYEKSESLREYIKSL